MIRARFVSFATCLMVAALAGIATAQPAPPTPAGADSLATAAADSLAKATARADSIAAAAAKTVAPVTTTTTPPASTPAAPPPAQTQAQAAAATPSEPTKLYYGGTFGFSFFNDQRRLYFQPMVGVELTPRLSVGGKIGYERLVYTEPADDISMNNWGASVFGRMKLVRNAYAHAEFAMWSYDYPGNRESVPFFLVGAGVIKPLRGNVALTAEVLFDVLQDDQSPYESSEPWVSVGVGVGF